MFGREELDLLTPAVQECAAAGIRVSGPHSADSLYYRAHTGEFDVVIAPYHDQGLVPVKLIAHGSRQTSRSGFLTYARRPITERRSPLPEKGLQTLQE